MAQKAFDELTSLLRKDEANLDQLLNVLETEHQALADNDMVSLESATRSKNEILEAIRERARRKIHSLAQLGYRPDSGQTPSDFLKSLSADEQLLTRWHQAQRQLERCHEKNAVNGRIVGHLQRRVTRISDIIRGVDQNQSLYSSGGEARSLSHSQVLTSA